MEGTTGERGEAALRGTHSQAALGNDRKMGGGLERLDNGFVVFLPEMFAAENVEVGGR